MAQFNQLVLTNKGAALLAKIQQSARPLVLIYAEVGDGVLPQGQSLQSLTALVSKKKDLAITSIVNQGNGSIKISLESISNAGLVQGMYIREIGLYATDPDEGNILYAVANAGNNADFLPPYSINPVEELINLIISVGQATTVTATIDQSMVYVTRSEINQLIKLPNVKLVVPQDISLPNASGQIITWGHANAEDYGDHHMSYDTHEMFNSSTPTEIKCKISGKYRISSCLSCNGLSNGHIQADLIYASTDEIEVIADMATIEGSRSSMQLHLNTTIELHEGDVIRVYATNINAGATADITMNGLVPSWICVECIELI